MSVRRVSGVATLVLGLAPCHAAEPAFDQALSGGKPYLSLRVRAENVRDDAFARDATAPTFRLRLGYETLPWHHATALLEVDHLGLWGGDAYNSTRNGRTDRPVVADPEATDLNQLALKITTPQNDWVLGRQRLSLDNQRFIGTSGWRQNEQTFDAATWRTRLVPHAVVTYVYLGNVNRVYGPDAGSPPPDLHVKGHVLHGSFDLKSAGRLAAFGHWMDVGNAPSLSHQNLGLLWTGSRAIGTQWKLPWSLSYVRQQDFGNNPIRYSARYVQAELGASARDLELRAGIEILSGDPARPDRMFQTPFSSSHPFQGWAGKFTTAPPQGIRDRYAAATARRWGWEAQLARHDFSAEAVSRTYGSEWDLSLTRKLAKRTELMLKGAQYRSDGLLRDTRRLWLQASADIL